VTLLNDLGQPIGDPVGGFLPPPPPPPSPIHGRCVRLEPLETDRHAAHLHAAFSEDPDGALWTYMTYGPFENEEAYREWVSSVQGSPDPMFFAIVDESTGRATGVASYLRVNPPAGSIEVGHIAFSPSLQRTTGATEAMYLMMRTAFAAGYRRYEWKCDALNEASRLAAERLGFTFEGVHRQAMIYKGRNRDTAWYSIIDRDWPALCDTFEGWLDPANFDGAGLQRTSLRSGAPTTTYRS